MCAVNHSEKDKTSLENDEVVRVAYSWPEKKDLIIDRYIYNMNSYDRWCHFCAKYQGEEYMAVVKFYSTRRLRIGAYYT